MQEIIEKLLLGILIVIIFFILIGLIQHANAADYSGAKELLIKNESGGYIAVTKEPCEDPKAKELGFEFMAYATEGNGTLHQGCWMMPDLSDAPNNPNIKIIPIVNMYFEGHIIMLPQNQFKPLHQLDNSL